MFILVLHSKNVPFEIEYIYLKFYFIWLIFKGFFQSRLIINYNTDAFKIKWCTKILNGTVIAHYLLFFFKLFINCLIPNHNNY